MEGEIAKVALSDKDCQLMSHPGIAPFSAVAIRARIGDASRFSTKKHLCSYAGVVPAADNSGERVSQHKHVKRGDTVLKHALTCAVRGAVRAKADSAVKRVYLRQIKRGRSEQEAEVNAARKLACIVWKMLTSKERYVEEDKYLTSRKTYRASLAANRILTRTAKPEDKSTIIKELRSKTGALERYSEQMHHAKRRSKSTRLLSRDSKEGMAKK